MATNYSQLEAMMQKRYKCTSLEIAEKVYNGRSDIAGIIKAKVGDGGDCEAFFEKHKGLKAILEGEKFKGRIGKAGAMDFLKRVVANWIAQDLFVLNLMKNKVTCELGKVHKDRGFEECLSVEPTAILWKTVNGKARHRLLDIQIVYGKSMEDGFVTVSKERFLKLIEKKTMLLTMNMTTLKYSLIDFYTTDTYSEEFVMGGGKSVVKIALRDSKCALNGCGKVREHIKQVLENTIGENAVKAGLGQANFVAVMEVSKDGKTKNLVNTYSIPEGISEKRKAAAEAKGVAQKACPPKEANQKPKNSSDGDATQPSDKSSENKAGSTLAEEKKATEVKSVEQAKPTVGQTAKGMNTEDSKATATTTPKAEQKPVQGQTQGQGAVEKAVTKPVTKPLTKPVTKPTPRVEEEDYGGYDFSALDSFA